VTASLRPSTPQQMGTAAVRGAFWLASDQIGSRVIDLAFSIVLARLLLPEAFGLLAMASASTAFFHLFANLGLAAPIVQRKEVDDEYLSTAFWANLASGVVLFAIVAASGGILGRLFREPRVVTIIIFLSLRFVIAAGSATQVAMISRRMAYRSLSLRSIVATAVGGLTGIALAYSGAGVWSLVGQELSRTLASTVLLYRVTGWRPKRQFSWAKFRDLWSFGGPLLLSRLFNYLNRSSDNVLIGRYLGATALGFYAFGFAIISAPLNDFISTVHRVIFSALSRLQDDDDRLKRAFLLATRYVTMMAMPVMVGLAFVGTLAVGVLFGPKWSPSGSVVSILALSGVVGMMTSLGPSGLMAVGRADLHLRGTILSTLAYVPAYAIGLRWGILGVATGHVVATAILTPIVYRFLAEATGVRWRELWDAVSTSIIGSAVMAVALAPAKWALESTGVPQVPALVLLVALGVVVYGAALWFLQRQAVLGFISAIRDARPTPRGRLVGHPEEAS